MLEENKYELKVQNTFCQLQFFGINLYSALQGLNSTFSIFHFQEHFIVIPILPKFESKAYPHFVFNPSLYEAFFGFIASV